MNMSHVISTNIDSVGYDGNTLYIRFNNGSLYAYYNVPKNIYDSLMSANSHGKYFTAHVKWNYPYERLS